MNDLKTKIKAFTLSEMLVVVLLTIIVVGLAFSVLGLVQKQMFDTRENLAVQSAENELRQALWRDFRSFSRIYGNRAEGILVFEQPFEKVNYQLSEGFVLRNLDTFKVKIKKRDFYFLGEMVEGGELDALKLELANTVESSIWVHKVNTAETYMD
nr:hypothetical protein [Allomuricauda sp.]